MLSFTEYNNYINIINCKIIERDSILIQLGFLNYKKIYYFIHNLLNIEEIDISIKDTNLKLLQHTEKINDYIKQYNDLVENHNKNIQSYKIIKIDFVKLVGEITNKSLKLYTPTLKSSEIDTISTIDNESLMLKEKINKIESKFMELQSIELRQKYLKNILLYVSPLLNSTFETIIPKYTNEINDNENIITALMSQINSYKNTLPIDLRKDLFMQLYKNYIDYSEMLV